MNVILDKTAIMAHLRANPRFSGPLHIGAPLPLTLETWQESVPHLNDWRIEDADKVYTIERGRALNFDTSGLPMQLLHGVNKLSVDAKFADDLLVHVFNDVDVIFTTFGFVVWRGDLLFSCSSAVPEFAPSACPIDVSHPVASGFYAGDMFRTNNICHHAFDHVGRACLAANLGVARSTDIFLPQSQALYQSFIKSNVAPDSIEVLNLCRYHFDTFYLFHDSFNPLNHPARHCDSRIMNSIRRPFESKTKQVSRGRFYLSRQDARNVRPLSNELQLQSSLERSGFQVVSMTDLTPSQQIRLVQEAAVIVAPHGAALTSIAHGKPGLKVVEIMNPNIGTLCYFKVATWAGLDYKMVLANQSDDTHVSQVNIELVLDTVR